MFFFQRTNSEQTYKIYMNDSKYQQIKHTEATPVYGDILFFF